MLVMHMLDITRKQIVYSAVANRTKNSLHYKNAKFTYATGASKDTKDSKVWYLFSMLPSPPVFEADVCLLPEKVAVMNQGRICLIGRIRGWLDPIRKTTWVSGTVSKSLRFPSSTLKANVSN